MRLRPPVRPSAPVERAPVVLAVPPLVAPLLAVRPVLLLADPLRLALLRVDLRVLLPGPQWKALARWCPP